jgi:hypothetical protein
MKSNVLLPDRSYTIQEEDQMFYYRTDLTPSKKKPNVLLPDKSYTIQEEAKCIITGQILHHPRRRVIKHLVFFLDGVRSVR